MYYPKIDTLFRRDDKFKVIPWQYRRPEFDYVDRWLWMEKLDGSNISIIAERNSIKWRGRTDKSNFIPDIQNHLNMRIESWNARLQEVLGSHKLDSFELFGEVYGPKIQNGGIYRDNITTKFYDIRVNGHMWLDWDTVIQYAEDLEFGVPAHYTNTTEEIVDSVRAGFHTYEHVFDGQPRPSEGVVMKTAVPLYNNRGDRLIAKLKHKDFSKEDQNI